MADGAAQHRPALGRPVGRVLRQLGHPLPRRPARHQPGAQHGRPRAAARRRQHHLLPPPQGHRRAAGTARRRRHRLRRPGHRVLPPAGPHPPRPRPGDRLPRRQRRPRRRPPPAARRAADRAAHRHPGRRLGRPAQPARRQHSPAPPSTSTSTASTCAAAAATSAGTASPRSASSCGGRSRCASTGRRRCRSPAAPATTRSTRPAGRSRCSPRHGAARNDYGESWLPIRVWQLPMPLTTPMWEAVAACRAPDPGTRPTPTRTPPSGRQPRRVGPPAPATRSTSAQVRVWPEVGRFRRVRRRPGRRRGRLPLRAVLPDRRRAVRPAPDSASRRASTRSRGDARSTAGSAISLPDAVAALGAARHGRRRPTGCTLPAVAVGLRRRPIADVTIRGDDEERAVHPHRAGRPRGCFTRRPAARRLRLEGLLVSGTDIVLRGSFDEVVLSCCTPRPGHAAARSARRRRSGTSASTAATWPRSPSGSRARCARWSSTAASPARSAPAPAASIETLRVADSVLQGLPTEQPGALTALRDARRPVHRADEAHRRRDPLSDLAGRAAVAAVRRRRHRRTPTTPRSPRPTRSSSSRTCRRSSTAPLIWTRTGSRDRAAARLAPPPRWPPAAGAALAALNRQLLAEAYPLALADAALAPTPGIAACPAARCSGRATLHRLECSESILDDVVRVQDAQDGCVRFSAWSTGSALPRRYESVQIDPGAPIMVEPPVRRVGLRAAARRRRRRDPRRQHRRPAEPAHRQPRRLGDGRRSAATTRRSRTARC